MKIYLIWDGSGIIGGYSSEGKARKALKQYIIDTGACEEKDFKDNMIDDLSYGIISHPIDNLWI